MYYTSEILAAPRPVRLASFAHHAPTSPTSFRSSSTVLDRKSASPTDAQDAGRLSPLTSDIVNRSPRLSPRPNSSEALDEFLSILRPAIPALFAPLPQSPVSRARRFLQNSFAERQYGNFHERSLSLTTSADNIVREGVRTPSRSPRLRTPANDENGELAPLRLTGPQGSPISRTHTRNPFQRHPSYPIEAPASPTPRSPWTYPLPPPTPSEHESAL